MLETLFNSEYCEIFTEHHLQKAAFDNEKEEYRGKIIDLKNIFPNISRI